jgi:hypothetical protein
MIVLVYKKDFNANDLNYVVPNGVVSLLHEFDDVFLKDIPIVLPLLRRIEH